MLFSEQVSFGTFALLYLGRCTKSRAKALEDAGVAMGTTRRDARRVVEALLNAGLIAPADRSGEYRLGRPLSQITVVDVLDTLAPPVSPVPCVENQQRLCVTYQEVWRLHERVRKELGSVKLASLLCDRSAQCDGARSCDGRPSIAAAAAGSGFQPDGGPTWTSGLRTTCCDPLHAAADALAPGAAVVKTDAAFGALPVAAMAAGGATCELQSAAPAPSGA